MRNSKDLDSVYHQIRKEEKLNEEEIFHDLIAMVLGGFDTSARSASAALYNLR